MFLPHLGEFYFICKLKNGFLFCCHILHVGSELADRTAGLGFWVVGKCFHRGPSFSLSVGMTPGLFPARLSQGSLVHALSFLVSFWSILSTSCFSVLASSSAWMSVVHDECFGSLLGWLYFILASPWFFWSKGFFFYLASLSLVFLPWLLSGLLSPD